MLVLLLFFTGFPASSLWGQDQDLEKGIFSSVSQQLDSDVGIIVPSIPPFPIPDPIILDTPVRLYMAWTTKKDIFMYVKVMGTAKDVKTVGALCKGIDGKYFFADLEEINWVDPILRNYANFRGQIPYVERFWLYYIKNNDSAIWDTNNGQGYSLKNPFSGRDAIIGGNISLIDMKGHRGDHVIGASSRKIKICTYLEIDVRIKKVGHSQAKSKL